MKTVLDQISNKILSVSYYIYIGLIFMTLLSRESISLCETFVGEYIVIKLI